MRKKEIKTILLVDDEVLIAAAEKINLENIGYNVIISYSGENAVEIIKKNDAVDLILMDIDLGKEIDGTEAAKIILKEREIPLVFFSNHTESEIVEKTEKITSYGYVVKNSGITVLDASIKMAFKLFEAHKNLAESEERYRSLFEKNNSIMLLINPDSTDIVDANESACNYYGWSHEEITKKKINEINILPESSIREELKKAVMEISKYFNFKHRLANGDIRDVEVYSGPITVSGRKLLYSIIHDVTKRRQAEEALNASEEKFRKAFMTSPDCFSINRLDDGVYVSINIAFTRIMGYSEEDILWKSSIEKNIWENPVDRKIFVDGLKKDGKVEEFEAMFRTKSGKIMLGMMSASLIILNGIEHTIVMVRDITERRHAEEALRESEERFSKAFWTSPYAFIITNMEDGRFIEVNDAFTSISGYTREEALASTTLDLNIWANDEDRLRMVAVLREGRAVVRQETMLRSKRGNIASVLLSAQVIRLGDKYCIISSIEDITERKRAEELLRESEAQYRTLIEQASEGIFVADSDGRYIDVNTSGCRLLGYNREEILNLTMQDVAEKTLEIPLKFDELQQGNILLTERRLIRKDGSFVPVEISAKKLSDGRLQGIVRDITERKQAEEALHNLTRMYSLLSCINQIIVRCHNQQEFFKSVCEAAIEKGGFGMVWIGKINSDINKVDVAASQGIEADYLKFINIDLNDEVRSNGPTGRAVKSAAHIISNDIQSDETMKPWKEAAKINAYQSSAAFPLIVEGKIWGTLNIYANEISFFNEEEVKLLDELANDIGFAIEVQRNETKRLQAEEEIKRQLQEKELMIKEVHHRIKNNIASIGSLLSLQLRSITNPEVISVLKDIIGRVNSMRLLYDKLILTENYENIPVKNYIEGLVDAILALFPDSLNITIDKRIEEFQLDSRRLFYLGIFINELISNIFKYAFVNRDSGLINIALKNVDNHITLTIRDNGVGLPAGFDINESKGFGIMLVKMLSKQFDGSFTIESHNGTRSILEFDI